MNETLIEIGGVGKFQALAFLVIESGCASVGYWYFPMGFYIQEPEYECTFSKSFSEEE